MPYFTEEEYARKIKEIKSGHACVNDPIEGYARLTLFRCAILDGKIGVARELVHLGAHVKDHDQQPSFWYIEIIRLKYCDFAAELIPLGVNVNKILYDGESVCTTALMYGNESFWNKILDAGCNINMKHPTSGNTGLHYIASCIIKAPRFNYAEIFMKMVQLGANINALSNDKKTPLDVCMDTKTVGYAYMYGQAIAYGAKCNQPHDGWMYQAVVRLFNKDAIMRLLVVKSMYPGNALCQLPVELIQELHNMLCGIKYQPTMIKGYKDAKMSKLIKINNHQ